VHILLYDSTTILLRPPHPLKSRPSTPCAFAEIGLGTLRLSALEFLLILFEGPGSTGFVVRSAIRPISATVPCYADVGLFGIS
jgi:hypothetical protein